jgi:hypothetical protein
MVIWYDEEHPPPGSGARRNPADEGSSMTATMSQKDDDLDAIVDALDALLTTSLEEDLKERDARKDEPLEIVW